MIARLAALVVFGIASVSASASTLEHIRAVNRTEAARRLGINRQLLYTKIERYGLDAGEASASMTGAVRNTDGREIE